jgi:sec-independent protein translocase protein TatA
VVLLVFGAKKLRTIGSDLGAAIKGFKKGMNEGDAEESLKQIKQEATDADFPESAKAPSTETKTSDRNG